MGNSYKWLRIQSQTCYLGGAAVTACERAAGRGRNYMRLIPELVRWWSKFRTTHIFQEVLKSSWWDLVWIKTRSCKLSAPIQNDNGKETWKVAEGTSSKELRKIGKTQQDLCPEMAKCNWVRMGKQIEGYDRRMWWISLRMYFKMWRPEW